MFISACLAYKQLQIDPQLISLRDGINSLLFAANVPEKQADYIGDAEVLVHKINNEEAA